MENGKIKWFSSEKGFGFIEVAGKDDVFVHISALEGVEPHELKEGTSVQFETTTVKGRSQASNVSKG